MKKIMLMIFLGAITMSCGKDEIAKITPDKPAITGLSVTKIGYHNYITGSGLLYGLSVKLTLFLPEEGVVKALDYIKSGTRYKDRGPVLKNGLNEFSTGGPSGEVELNGTYTFILVLKDGTEVTSAPQIVK